MIDLIGLENGEVQVHREPAHQVTTPLDVSTQYKHNNNGKLMTESLKP